MDLNTHLNAIGLRATPDAAATCGARAWQHLRDWVPIRTLAERHRKQVCAHLLALEADDRQRRFGHTVSDERLRLLRKVVALNFDSLIFEPSQVGGKLDQGVIDAWATNPR